MHSLATSYAPRFLRMQLPRVCVAVHASNVSELLQKLERVMADNSFIEIRLDYISKPELALPKVKQFLSRHPGIIAIGTCRRALNGGKFRGSTASQYGILLKAAQAGFRLIDIEIETAEQLKPAEFERLRSHVGIVLSSHDFRGTRKLEDTWRKLQQFPADCIKIVSTARTLSDNVAMMRLLESHSDQQSMVGLC